MNNTTSPLLPVLILVSLAFLSSCTTSTSDTVVKTSQTSTAEIQDNTQKTMTSSIKTTTIDTSSVTTIADNTITKNTTYNTDHGKHRVTASFALTQDTDGTITAVTATMTSGDHESRQYINRFNSAARSQIVGKKISELSLSAVGGASDTTDAFLQVVSSL